MSPVEQRLLCMFVQALTTALAWSFGVRRPRHRIIAVLYFWQLSANLGRLALAPTLDAVSTPYQGLDLALYYLDHALALSVPFAVLGGVWSQLGARVMPPYAVGGAFLLTFGALVAYKIATLASLQPFHEWTRAVVVIVGLGLFLRTIFGHNVRFPDGVDGILLFLLASDGLNVLVHVDGRVAEAWPEVRHVFIVTDAVVIAVYLTALFGPVGRRWLASRS